MNDRHQSTVPLTLAQLGFCDAQDDDNPHALFHPCGVTISADLDVSRVVALVYQIGRENGRREVRGAIRAILGV